MMKVITYSLIALGILMSIEGKGQAYFKAEYFGASGYHDENNHKMANAKGSAKVYQGGINIPLSVKMDENKKPTIWGVGLSGAYASLDNKNFADDLVLSEIMNLQLTLFHIRPLNEKWSVMAGAGAGIYATDTRFSNIRYRNVLGNAGVIFIRHLKPNLEIGGGVAFNNAFGIPMLFPALYFNWSTEGRYAFKVSMMNGLEMSAGRTFNKHLNLNLVAEMNGQGAFLKKDGKEQTFTHQYVVVGLRPEIKINKSISLSFTGGFHALRTAFYDERSLKAFFNGMNREYDPYFTISPYASAGIKFEF